jgi:hypothetical protein
MSGSDQYFSLWQVAALLGVRDLEEFRRFAAAEGIPIVRAGSEWAVASEALRDYTKRKHPHRAPSLRDLR